MTLKTVTGDTLTLTGLLKALRDMFRLGAVASDGKMNPSGSLSFTKIRLFGWISGS